MESAPQRHRNHQSTLSRIKIMKVTIKSVTAVAAWRWDVREDDELCGICRVDYDATCPTCKFPGDGCPLGLFLLSFVFHALSSSWPHVKFFPISLGIVQGRVGEGGKHANHDEVAVSGNCKHTFHSHCLHNWLSQESAQGRCPMCRQGSCSLRQIRAVLQATGKWLTWLYDCSLCGHDRCRTE